MLLPDRPVARTLDKKPMPSRHRFLEPIHNVKEVETKSRRNVAAAELLSSYLETRAPFKHSTNLVKRLVEPIGIEPMTSSLQS